MGAALFNALSKPLHEGLGVCIVWTITKTGEFKMKKQYKVTFTYRGYGAGVFFNKSASESEAIDSAKLYMSNKWTKVNAVLVDDEIQEN